MKNRKRERGRSPKAMYREFSQGHAWVDDLSRRMVGPGGTVNSSQRWYRGSAGEMELVVVLQESSGQPQAELAVGGSCHVKLTVSVSSVTVVYHHHLSRGEVHAGGHIRD